MNIESLIQEAKEFMLTSGNVMPMCHLQLEKTHVFIVIDVLSDSQSIPVQCGILARLGWEECKKYPDEKLVAIGFYAEAWQSIAPENVEQRLRPKLDRNRKEVIIVEVWQADNKRESCELPVVRDHKKRVVAIGNAERLTDRISWQLASIVQGARDSQKPDKEVFSRMDDEIAKKFAGLSPEQREMVRRFAREEGIPEDLLRDDI